MKKQKTTKRALLLSALSLLVCVSMLIGSTFAWFTDSVTSGVNTIQAGNLDVVLEYAAWDSTTGTWTEYSEVSAEKCVFNENALWEPGYTEVVKFRVTNAGTLALKYQFGMDVYSETGSTNVENEKFKLSDFILVGSTKVSNVTDRNEAAQYATKSIHDAKMLNVENVWSVEIPADFLYPENSPEGQAAVNNYCSEWVFVIHMPETVGNEANHKTGVEAPKITFGVNLIATQATYEKDSFDDQYDAGAEAEQPPVAWDGSVDISWFDAGKTEFTISNGAQLAGMAVLGNQLGGKTVTLDSDIDLGGKNWTPIKIFAPEQSFTFDGGNHTIYNLNITGGSPDVGLFDNSVGTIKNLKLSDAQIKSSGRSAILAGRHYGDIINCHVKDSTIEDSYWAVGGIVGQLNSGNVRDCSVTNVNVKSNGGTGGIVGVLNETPGIRTVENCSVNGGTIENVGLYGPTYSGGGIVGMINISNPTVNITGCSSTATLKGEYIYEICPPA